MGDGLVFLDAKAEYSSQTVLSEAMWLIALFLVGTFIAQIIWLGVPRVNVVWSAANNEREAHSVLALDRRLLLSCLVLTGLSVSLTSIRIAYGLGVMGGEPVVLPFGFQSVIFRAQSHLLPALYAMILAYGFVNFKKTITFFAITGFVLHYSAGVLTGSKSGVIFAVIWILFVYLLVGRQVRTVSVFAWMLLLIPLSVGLYILGLSFRGSLIGGTSVTDTLVAVADALDIRIINIYLNAIMHRVSGLEGLLVSLSWFDSRVFSVEPAFELLIGGGAKYYTGVIYGLGIENDFRAPGIVGFLFLIGQSSWAVILAAMVLRLMLEFLLALRLTTNPFVNISYQATVLFFALSVIMEGYFRYEDLLSVIATCFACAVLHSLIFGKLYVRR